MIVIKRAKPSEPPPAPAPSYSQLWKLKRGRRILRVLGNSVSSRGTIWCADDATGERVDAPVRSMRHVADRPLSETVTRCSDWARAGNSDALWFLGWYHDGTNHPKSVWYTIAAMRRSPELHGWALDRLYSDAHSAHMCSGVPAPDLSFLKQVKEFQDFEAGGRGRGVEWGDWQEAHQNAEAAVHQPAAA